MVFTQIRHATCIIDFTGTKFLVDPILYEKNTLDPVKGGINEKNPLVDITVQDEIIKNIDFILLTHMHRDHFDPDIADFFGKDIPVICNKEYEKQLLESGVRNVGRHGTGVVGKLMGNSYGFVLADRNGSAVYITGDTVWCKCVENVIETHTLEYIVALPVKI